MKKYEPNTWEVGREFYAYLTRMGYMHGYTITPRSDDKTCSTCEGVAGFYKRLSESTPLTPMHPHCRCKVTINWNPNANREIIYGYYYNFHTGETHADHHGYKPTADFIEDAVAFFQDKYGEDMVIEPPLAYDFETGTIGENCTRKIIMDTITEELRLAKPITWKQILFHGIYRENNEGKKVRYVNQDGIYAQDGKTIIGDAKDINFDEMVGMTTMLDARNIVNVDSEYVEYPEDSMDYWVDEAIGQGKGRYTGLGDWSEIPVIGDVTEFDINSVNAGRVVKNSHSGAKYDLKSHDGEDGRLLDAFGEKKENGERKNQGFVWKGEFLSYDETGNIIIGVAAGAHDLPLDWVNYGTNEFALLEWVVHLGQGREMFEEERDYINIYRGWKIGQASLKED